MLTTILLSYSAVFGLLQGFNFEHVKFEHEKWGPTWGQPKFWGTWLPQSPFPS